MKELWKTASASVSIFGFLQGAKTVFPFKTGHFFNNVLKIYKQKMYSAQKFVTSNTQFTIVDFLMNISPSNRKSLRKAII